MYWLAWFSLPPRAISLLISLPFVFSLLGCSDARDKSGVVDPPPNERVANPIAVVCWGDSMTAGNEGIFDTGEYPPILEQEIGHDVINEGVGGQTSTQIGVRQGGVPTYVTVVGGVIPSSGGVGVEFKPGYEPLTSRNGSVKGSILGVEGKVTLSAALPDGKFTFTRKLGGASEPAPGTPRFIPDTPYIGFLPIFWEGRNNLLRTLSGPWGPDQILSDLAAQVKTVPPDLHYLVLSVLNENAPSERRGSANYKEIVELNEALAATYGAHYLDIRSILVNSYNPSQPVDISDHQNDMPPTTLGAISAMGTLTSSIGSTEESFSVNITAGELQPYSNLVIGSESIHVVATDGSTVTQSIRGYGGIAAPHSAGTAVAEIDATHLNKFGYAIVAKAVAAKLAATSSLKDSSAQTQ